MNGIIKVKFKECDVNDHFFDSLKKDYQNFEKWFEKKAEEDVYVIIENNRIEGFLYLKYDEYETLTLKNNKSLYLKYRIKIGTLKTNETIKNRRYGEGFIGMALWQWSKSNCDEIYVTIFEKQINLIGMLKRYGFRLQGELINSPGELVFLKTKNCTDYSNPYSSFPYINKANKGKLIIVNEDYHDDLFPYSNLKNTSHHNSINDVRNGITKCFVSQAITLQNLKTGDFAIVYRKAHINSYYKSCVTSICSVVNVIIIKDRNNCYYSFDEFEKLLVNKTSLTNDELLRFYNENKPLLVVNLLYAFYFGKGSNINYKILLENGLWNQHQHPYNKDYSYDDLKKLYQLGVKK